MTKKGAEDGSDQETDPNTALIPNLMWNATRKRERSSLGGGKPDRRKLGGRYRRGGRRDHPREGWGALAVLFKNTSQDKNKRKIDQKAIRDELTKSFIPNS